MELPESILLATGAMSALCCVLVAYVIYKVRQVHRTLYGTDYLAKTLSRNLSQNLQNLDLLSHALQLDRPLPPLRGWVASPDILLLLARHVLRRGPEVIVECGSGASTIVLAQAAKLNGRGRVYSIDHDAAFAEKTREMLAEYGLSDWAEVTSAPLRWIEIAGTRWEWYDPDALPRTPPIDLLFVDGPPGDTPKPLARYPAGPILFPRLSPRGTVFADDTDRPGETEVLRRWSAGFPLLAQHRHFCEKGCYELRRDVPLVEADGVFDVMPGAAIPQRISSS